MRSRGISGEFTCKIGERISKILLSELDTLSLMLEDGLLEKFYRHSAPLIRNSEQAALLVDNLATTVPEYSLPSVMTSPISRSAIESTRSRSQPSQL